MSVPWLESGHTGKYQHLIFSYTPLLSSRYIHSTVHYLGNDDVHESQYCTEKAPGGSLPGPGGGGGSGKEPGLASGVWPEESIPSVTIDGGGLDECVVVTTEG